MKLFATAHTAISAISVIRKKRRISVRLLWLSVLVLSLCAFVLADEPLLRIARISLLEGEVSYQRAGDTQKDWFDATINTPLGENDHLYTGRNGRVEIQFTGRNLVRLNHDTNLSFTQFTTGTTQLALSIGTATFHVESLDRRQFQIVNVNDPDQNEPVYFEVDTPTVAITFLKEGSYRVNVLDDGTTEVIVRRGQAEVYNQVFGTIPVKQGRRMLIEGNDVEAWRVAKLDDKDEWDRWDDRRHDDLSARSQARSAQYVPQGVPGLHDLDYYGDWYDTPDYGWVWSPRIVTVGWAPYRSGYWRWYPSYGWTWISYEPWGWAPYHYGRWAYYRSRWCWLPQGGFGVSIASWSWHPSLVVFFGWGNGNYRRGYRDGYRDGYREGYFDNVGWVPLGPRERYYGSYGYIGHGRTIINNNITINNTTIIAPRSIGDLANASAPGGITNIEGRRFSDRRVVVDAGNPGTQIARTKPDDLRAARPFSARGVDLQPRQPESPRATPVMSETVSRRMSAGVIQRRVPDIDASGSDRNGVTDRTVEHGVPALRGTGRAVADDAGRATPDRPATREGQNLTDRNLPVDRGREIRNEVTGRAADSAGERARRMPDFRPVERPVPPTAATRRAASEDSSEINRSFGSPRTVERNSGRTIDRSNDRRVERSAPPASSEPNSYPRNEDRSSDQGRNRNSERPVFTPSRRVETPVERSRPEPRAEPREAPRSRPVERSVERPVERRVEPASPPRAERQSSPPPERSRPAENSSGRSRGRPDNQ